MVPYDEYTDSDLMSLVSGDDQVAFATIYKRHRAQLYMHAYRMLDDKDDASDVVQEIFTTLWTRRKDVTITTSVGAYLYKAVRHRILDMLGRRKTQNNYLNSLASFLEEGDYITDKQVRENELNALLEKEIARLPAKMREVFELSRYEYLSYHEIAVKLNISDNTVRNQVHNALNILKDKLDLTYLQLLIIICQF